jgi:hypothetical protein
MSENAESCGTCKHFQSYAAIYEDDLEPHDIGECHHDVTHLPPPEKCGIHDDNSCENWESEKNI